MTFNERRMVYVTILLIRLFYNREYIVYLTELDCMPSNFPTEANVTCRRSSQKHACSFCNLVDCSRFVSKCCSTTLSWFSLRCFSSWLWSTASLSLSLSHGCLLIINDFIFITFYFYMFTQNPLVSKYCLGQCH